VPEPLSTWVPQRVAVSAGELGRREPVPAAVVVAVVWDGRAWPDVPLSAAASDALAAGVEQVLAARRNVLPDCDRLAEPKERDERVEAARHLALSPSAHEAPSSPQAWAPSLRQVLHRRRYALI